MEKEGEIVSRQRKTIYFLSVAILIVAIILIILLMIMLVFKKDNNPMPGGNPAGDGTEIIPQANSCDTLEGTEKTSCEIVENAKSGNPSYCENNFEGQFTKIITINNTYEKIILLSGNDYCWFKLTENSGSNYCAKISSLTARSYCEALK